MDNSKLQAVLAEIAEIRKAMEATRGAIYTAFGVVMPAVVGVFVLAAKAEKPSWLDQATLATGFVILASLGAMWTQNLWMELLRYVRYYYVVLLPRLYRASDQHGEPNFLQWSRDRSSRSWIPITLFNVGSLVVLLVTYVALVAPAGRWVLDGLNLLFVAGSAVSVLSVMVEVRAVEGAISAVAPRSGGSESPT